jgi:hypothetical protein
VTNLRLHALVACVATLAVVGCGKDESSSGATGRSAAGTERKAVEEKVLPYTYPAPVKGHYKEVNIGEFDVVDGIAYPATGGAGTVVYVTSKPIASPAIAGSMCPMTQARALTQIRSASFMEVTIAHGVSKYFAAGKAFDGSSREEAGAGKYWSTKMKDDPERATGSVVHKLHGSFDFDLPLSSPKVNEVSEGDRVHGIRSDLTAPKPAEAPVTAAYNAVHDAAIKKNLRAMLAAQGFDAKEIAALRGLEGIDADLDLYSDRFLSGTPGEFSAKPGTADVRVEGVNSKGKKFANYYHFAPCGDHFVLVSIAENPQ